MLYEVSKGKTTMAQALVALGANIEAKDNVSNPYIEAMKLMRYGRLRYTLPISMYSLHLAYLPVEYLKINWIHVMVAMYFD